MEEFAHYLSVIKIISLRLKDRRGSAAADYALLVASISLFVLTGVRYLGTNLRFLFFQAGNIV